MKNLKQFLAVALVAITTVGFAQTPSEAEYINLKGDQLFPEGIHTLPNGDLLVGGFGIANIMFVSVKERTNLIGIQKSLGAKNKFILLQFLFEAIILSVFGGIIGLFLVWIISLILTYALDFEFILGLGNILLGTGLAAFIGLVAGILPAISASKLDPVEAIRSGM